MKRSPNLVREKSKKENSYFAEDEDPIRLSIDVKKRSNQEFNIRKKLLKNFLFINAKNYYYK
jgi:hypothetical protein